MCEVQASFTISLSKPRKQEISEKSNKIIDTEKNKTVMMSFVDNLWSMEISGGFDQSSPLIVVAVKKNGLAKRAGIKVGDIISHINNMSTNKMTLIDAQLEIQECGKSLKLTVKG